jgi:hypothetical protein
MNLKQQTLFYGSSYDRGLDIFLPMWPEIKAKFPNAELNICYGWDLYDRVAVNNPERQQWKEKMVKLMHQEGIIHHGRVGKKELKEIRSKCGVWVYPTYFPEINCITALDCQRDGLVPVTMDFAALTETVQSGFKVNGDINKPEVQKQWLDKLLEVMSDKVLWTKESKKAQKFATKFYWNRIADEWIKEFEVKPRDVKVTIYTPTLREGFWNLMSNNIAVQTHKNLEWVIVDAHKDNRKEIVDKYAHMYDLDIKYIHQKKTKRTYSLCNANNLAIAQATGELFVFLQDFVLMPPDGIEKLVNVYLHHPNDFIAPVDVYYSPKIKPDTTNKEDWFNGELDVAGDFIRKNIRVQNFGFRQSKEVTDFEQNYGAVGLHVLKQLGGYYEFFDEALGWDDTEILYRGWKRGCKLYIDDTNIALCIDHWGTLGNDEGGTGENRSRRSNEPRFVWLMEQVQKGKLPIVRNKEIDKKLDLQYEVPEEISDEDCDKWVKKNVPLIIKSWENKL